MILRVHPTDFKVKDLRDPAMGYRGWWAARCVHCRTWITKYDHSPEDALRYAIGAGHRCSDVTR
jgi:hypothetical protein